MDAESRAYTMSTPTKRRRTNAYRSSPQAVGSIDFFFGKQKAKLDSEALENGVDNRVHSQVQSPDKSTHKIIKSACEDEELARRLQNEWDKEEKELKGGDLAKLEEKLPNASSLPLQKPSNTSTELNSSPNHQESPSSPTHAAEISELYPGKKVTSAPEKKATLSLQATAAAENSASSTIPFDVSPLTFNPGEYVPALRKNWAIEDGDASYGLLTRCFILVNSTQSRIKIVDTLVNFLRTVIEGDPESLLPAVSDGIPFDVP